MRFGVCLVPYQPHGWLPKPPSLQAWKTLREVGITDVRISIPLQYTFPNSNIENWKLLDNFIPVISKAGLYVYQNPSGCPPWASEGQPAYIGTIAAWPPETPVPPAEWGGTHWWDDPVHPDANHIHFFDPRMGGVKGGSDANTFSAIDAQQPPRPYLQNPPQRSPEFFEEYAGYKLAMKYEADSYGVENEPGSFDRPEMHVLDKAYVKNGSDTISERFFPEMVLPYSAGVRRANPNATLVGPEADSADILDRCCELEDELYRGRPSLSCYDVLSVHPYGDLLDTGKPSSYRTMAAFDRVLKAWKSRRPIRIGEIGGDPQVLYDWTVEMLRTRQSDIESIFYLEPSYFFEMGSWPNTPVLSAIGSKFKELFTTIGG